VEKAGGVPLLLSPTLSPALAGRVVDRIDGLLVPGGADLSPRRYGQRPHPAHRPLPSRLEDFWFRALEEADRRRMAILGICLGSQVLNVARGGTLVQDIPTQWPDPVPHRPEEGTRRRTHPVIVAPGTFLASIVGEGRLETNSSHHQAIDRPGRGLVVSARAQDGVIEAVEDPGHPFYLAIQWHPEGMVRRAKHLALFRAFVEAAAAGG
jgi:putative glutamine amidotransferase